MQIQLREYSSFPNKYENKYEYFFYFYKCQRMSILIQYKTSEFPVLYYSFEKYCILQIQPPFDSRRIISSCISFRRHFSPNFRNSVKVLGHRCFQEKKARPIDWYRLRPPSLAIRQYTFQGRFLDFKKKHILYTFSEDVETETRAVATLTLAVRRPITTRLYMVH